jgi:cysteine desulfuration protein SufE
MNPSSVQEKEAAIVARYLIIEDSQERLQALLSRKPQVPAIPPEECSDALLVKGCSSPVWLDATLADKRLFIRMESTGPLVKPLVGLLCDLCHQAPAREVLAFQPTWIQALRLESTLSPTRQQGLRAVFLVLQGLAAGDPRLLH